ncbi:hypothetical protein [Kitasatospora sp. NPDC047058]|uniref:hypothetical protein n=1 Tax=Kitasatospora sp. NPDC047058 TaxID=3155620 RepID=UPI0033DA7BA3
MSTWGERRAAREAQLELEREQAAELARRTEVFEAALGRKTMALQRKAWARGDGIKHADSVEVTGPDGEPVRIRVQWGLGTGEPEPGTGKGGGKRGGRGTGAIGDPVGVIAAVVVAVLALLGLGLAVKYATRWLYLELTGRPHYAVVAEDGARRTVTTRSRRRRESLLAAAALADEIERTGTAAVRAR